MKGKGTPRLVRVLGQPLAGPPPQAAQSVPWTIKESARPSRVSG